ncbi:hypothetical protein MKW98_008143 [Papaver atlanticum]|uniref:Uncharacterized protein n=1 Tax=Papaver atlanticum TaxID=357466 RepID=A0AAD4S9H1_9MAGN|nr:hypothetical protein MKW98_008143 [Papaver atlanticum]
MKLYKGKKILSICDRGIRMTKEDLIKNLGTIAKSRTSGIFSTYGASYIHFPPFFELMENNYG